MRTLTWPLLALIAGVLLTEASFARAQETREDGSDGWTVEQLEPGVELRRRHFSSLFDAPQHVSVLSVDLDEPGVRVRFGTAWQFDRDRMSVPEIGCRAGAIAAMNAGFGHGGPEKVNSGIFKLDGEVFPFLKEEPEELRFVGSAAVGIDEDGEWHFKERPGDRWPADWEGIPNALAGGHMLLTGGAIHPSVDRDSFDSDREQRHAGARHPRSAACTTGERTALLVALDGRHEDRAEGLTLRELAAFMQDLGCIDALNLDGGGSTTMWTDRHGVVNHPSDNRRYDGGGTREIRTVVLVVQN